MEEPVFLHGKKIGVVHDDPNGFTYRTWRDPLKHFFVKYNGYAIDYDVLAVLKKKGVERVVLSFDHPRGKTEASKIEWWFSPEAIRTKQPGYDLQCVLPENVRNHKWYELLNKKLGDWCEND